MNRWTCVLGLLAVFAFACQAPADSISLDTSFFGTTPTSPAPWGVGSFSNSGSGVVLTLTPSLSASADKYAYISQWDFNLNPALNPALLSFSLIGSSGSFTAPTVSLGTNAFLADTTGGHYDIKFAFSFFSRFGNGDSATYDITYQGRTLTAGDFDYATTDGGQYYSAAYLLGLNYGCSCDWVASNGAGSDVSAVPEPTLAASLIGLAGMGLLYSCRRPKRA